MTTIVATRHEIAVDSRSSDDAEFYTSSKAFRGHDFIAACAGDVQHILAFKEWLLNPCGDTMPDTAGNFCCTAVVVRKDGIWAFHNGVFPHAIGDKFYTEGSGSMAARAAMLCGKTPAEAVRIAIRCDKNSGGPVRVLRLDPKRKS